MAATLFEPAAAPKVPTRVQVARVLCLARLLTFLTAVASAVTIVAVRWVESMISRDIPLDQRLLDWRIWPAVFAFWLAVFAAARRHLRLDIRP